MFQSWWRFLRGRLRARTAALFLLGGVTPVLLTGLAAWHEFETDLVARMIGDHSRLISQVSSELSGEIDWHMGQLERLGRQANVQSGVPERMRPDLEAFLAFHPLFHQVGVYAGDRRLLAAATRGSLLGSASPAARLPPALSAAFERALSDSQPSVLPASGSEKAHVQIPFLAAVPSFVDDRPPVGAVVAYLRLHGPEIQSLVDRLHSVGGTTYLVLTGPDGQVVARIGHGAPAHLWSMKVERPAPAGRTSSDEALVTGVGRVCGRKDLLAAATIPSVGLRVVVGRPYAEVSAAMLELLSSVGLYLAVGILLATLLGLYLSRGLVGPILSLVDGIQRVARGEVAHRLPVEREDELGQAANAFNEMARQLEKGRLLEELWQSRWGARR